MSPNKKTSPFALIDPRERMTSATEGLQVTTEAMKKLSEDGVWALHIEDALS